ncbi:MAG: hypothetical protein CM1200mP2_12710 [Planctomycetaceae bacterium]|nr:MAG: hypothetical protein CM1200mP2_12710 [Planctomycetaceae bacterium]
MASRLFVRVSWLVSWRSLEQPVEVDGEELAAAVIVAEGGEASLVREKYAVVDQQKQVAGESPVGEQVPFESEVVVTLQVGPASLMLASASDLQYQYELVPISKFCHAGLSGSSNGRIAAERLTNSRLENCGAKLAPGVHVAESHERLVGSGRQVGSAVGLWSANSRVVAAGPGVFYTGTGTAGEMSRSSRARCQGPGGNVSDRGC